MVHRRTDVVLLAIARRAPLSESPQTCAPSSPFLPLACLCTVSVYKQTPNFRRRRARRSRARHHLLTRTFCRLGPGRCIESRGCNSLSCCALEFSRLCRRRRPLPPGPPAATCQSSMLAVVLAPAGHGATSACSRLLQYASGAQDQPRFDAPALSISLIIADHALTLPPPSARSLSLDRHYCHCARRPCCLVPLRQRQFR